MRELLRAALSQFEKNHIATVDAELLLAHLLGVSRKQVHSQVIELTEAEKEKISAEFNDLIKQRLLGRPVQYITVDRSERIRTYNFPENRLSDHRVNYKANNLDSVMNGDLDAVIQALIDADRTAKLSAGNS